MMQLVFVNAEPDDVNGFISVACNHLLSGLNKTLNDVLPGYYQLTTPFVLPRIYPATVRAFLLMVCCRKHK
jgi:hypothetical protein